MVLLPWRKSNNHSLLMKTAMSKFSKKGLLKDVDPEDVIVFLKTAGKILKDLRKKDPNATK